MRTTEASSTDVAKLAEMNLRFGEEERRGARGEQFFEDGLDSSLRFRRGDGSVATKESFLKGLQDPSNTNELLTTEIVQIQVLGEQAFVEAHVRFKGSRKRKPVEGVFRNLRLFEKRENRWRCVMWFNKKIGSLERAAPPS
jgi:hypothetical protein